MKNTPVPGKGGRDIPEPTPPFVSHTHAHTELCGSAWTPRGGVTDTLLRAEADIHLDSKLYTTLTLQVCCIKLEDQEQLTFFSADSVKICSGGLDNTLTTFTLYSPHTSTHQQVFTDLKSLRNIVKISINQSIRHVHGELTERSLL